MISCKRDVVCCLQNNKLFKDYRILCKKSGLSNNNYIIESNSKKYIVRSSKKKPGDYINVLKNEANVLRFLESKKIDFVPRSLFYDEISNIHILTYIEGRKIRFRNISSSGIDQAIIKLHQVNILAEEYREYCKKNKIPALKPKSEITSIEKRILKKLEAIEKKCIFSEYIEWILLKLKNDFSSYKQSKKIIFLNHGDPADNLIINGKKISIIDWEYVKYSYGPGLVHILAHGRLDEEKEAKLLKSYAKISEIDYDELCHKIYREKMIHYLLKIAKILVKNNNNKLELDECRKSLEILKNKYLKYHQMADKIF